MRIHSRELLYFDAVRRAGSIREAARKLNVASSAVNRKILQIEEEIGTPLFERHAGGVVLTAAGEALARHAITVLQDLDRTTAEIEALQGGQRGRVSLAAVESICLSPLPEVIREVFGRAPRIEIEVQAMGSQEIPHVLSAGGADIGIAFDLAPAPDLRRIYSARFALGAVMSRSHPLAVHDSVSIVNCAEFPLVRAQSNLSMARRIEQAMAEIDLAVPASVTTDSVALMQRLVSEPPHISFQTRIGLNDTGAADSLAFVPLRSRGGLFSELGIFMRAGRSLPAAVDVFLQVLTQHLGATHFAR
ncbi:LysR family transcriptional regulator [Amaricoccus macauensis]|uniref:LysR family transcriptional regulator n=1 Tax=Amaricoccus macauensis TaxID=57001 RepID=UPI003C7D0807